MTETTGQSNENGKAKETELSKNQQNESNDSQAKTPPPKEMTAIVLQSFGGIKSVKVLKKPEPTLGENEVLIRVKTCGLNFPDLMLRQGIIDNPPRTPFILGYECAGVVEGIGEGVEGLKVGDRVCALPEAKAWAELVVVPAKYVYQIPDEMTFQDAVAITMNFTVAYCLLFDVGNLKSGQTILIHSVGGGVGHALTQLAKTVPNVTVIGTASKHKHESLKDNVTHLFDYSNDYFQSVKKLFPSGVDLVLDCFCGDDANKGYNLLKPLGQYVVYGASRLNMGLTRNAINQFKLWWQLDKLSLIKLYDENKTLSGFNLRRLLYQQNGHEYVRGIVEQIYKLYKAKTIKPVIDSAFALEDVTEAMQKIHDRKNVGKIILDLSLEPKPRPPEEEVTKSGKKKSNAKDKSDEKKEKEKEKDSKAAETQNGETETQDKKKEEIEAK